MHISQTPPKEKVGARGKCQRAGVHKAGPSVPLDSGGPHFPLSWWWLALSLWGPLSRFLHWNLVGTRPPSSGSLGWASEGTQRQLQAECPPRLPSGAAILFLERGKGAPQPTLSRGHFQSSFKVLLWAWLGLRPVTGHFPRGSAVEQGGSGGAVGAPKPRFEPQRYSGHLGPWAGHEAADA